MSGRQQRNHPADGPVDGADVPLPAPVAEGAVEPHAPAAQQVGDENQAENALFMQVLADAFNNGGQEAGINANNDGLIEANTNLVIGRNIKSTLHGVWQCGNNAAQVFVNAAAVILHAEPGLREEQWVTNEVGRVAPADYTAPTFDTKAATGMILLAYASKVAWWQTNHHMGGQVSKAIGYIAKVMRHLGLNPDDQAHTHPVWVISHWFHTPTILNAIGIEGLRDVHALNGVFVLPRPAHDIRMRMVSKPSGTALLFDTLQVLKSVRGSIHGNYLQRDTDFATDFATLEAICAAISREPARYHIGARYLTGREPANVPDIPGNLAQTAAAAVKTFLSGSSIAKASSFGRVDADATYVSLWQGLSGGITKAAVKLAEADIAELKDQLKGEGVVVDQVEVDRRLAEMMR